MSFNVQKGEYVIVCWSAKGGSGTSVVAALLSLSLAKVCGATVLVDMQGDQPAVLGLTGDHPIGVRQWAHADADVSPEALARLTVPVSGALQLLPSGPLTGVEGPLKEERAATLGLSMSSRGHVVIDAGVCTGDQDAAAVFARSAATSLLVTRPCYLSLKRASALSVKPTAIVVIDEPSRSLDSRDVEDVLQVPVVALVRWDPAVARAVDAGRLTSPRFKSSKALDDLAKSLTIEAASRAS